MDPENIMGRLVAGVLTALFGLLIWFIKAGQSSVHNRLEEVEKVVTLLEKEVTGLSHIAESQQEIKRDVKEIHTVVTDLRVTIAALDRRSHD